MLDGITKVLDRLTNRQTPISKRLGNLILLVFALLIVDFTFQITHSIYQTNKLSNLEKVVSLKESYKDDPEQLNYLEGLEKNLLRNNHYYYYMESAWSYSRQTFQETQYRNGDTDLNYFWTVFSSSCFILGLMLSLIITFVIDMDYSMSKLRRLGVIILSSLTLTSFMIMISSIIPVIFNPILTYIGLFFIQILILMIITFYMLMNPQTKK